MGHAWLESCQPVTFEHMAKVSGLDQPSQERMGVANSLRLATYPNAIGTELREFNQEFQLLHCYIGDQFLPNQKDSRRLVGELIANQLNQPCQPNKAKAIFSFRAHFDEHLSVLMYNHQVEGELLCKLQSLRQFFRDKTGLAVLQLYLIDGQSAYLVPE